MQQFDMLFIQTLKKIYTKMESMEDIQYANSNCY